MAISVLQLPVDIPWRRVGVSMYMIDADVCDRRRPLEMLPSVAVFRYDPADESYDLGDDLAVSYLKVTCSITSYKRLIDLIRNLRDVITARGAWRLSRSREGGLPEVMREQEPILIYLKERNPQAAPQAMHDHLTLTGNALLDKLEKEDEAATTATGLKASPYLPRCFLLRSAEED